MSPSDEEAPVDPAAVAADAVITDFRTLHNDALLDVGHIDHSRRALELKGLYEKGTQATARSLIHRTASGDRKTASTKSPPKKWHRCALINLR